jgi:hypothetical protein
MHNRSVLVSLSSLVRARRRQSTRRKLGYPIADVRDRLKGVKSSRIEPGFGCEQRRYFFSIFAVCGTPKPA